MGAYTQTCMQRSGESLYKEVILLLMMVGALMKDINTHAHTHTHTGVTFGEMTVTYIHFLETYPNPHLDH